MSRCRGRRQVRWLYRTGSTETITPYHRYVRVRSRRSARSAPPHSFTSPFDEQREHLTVAVDPVSEPHDPRIAPGFKRILPRIEHQPSWSEPPMIQKMKPPALSCIDLLQVTRPARIGRAPAITHSRAPCDANGHYSARTEWFGTGAHGPEQQSDGVTHDRIVVDNKHRGRGPASGASGQGSPRRRLDALPARLNNELAE